jgi:multicomponent Na+:H+ antiporter subunit F
MIAFDTVIVTLAMALMLVRLFRGPTLYDRVLAVNSFGTKTVLFLVLFAYLIDRPDAIDIAILYALINFVGTIAILKFFRYRAFDLALARMSEEPAASDADVRDDGGR